MAAQRVTNFSPTNGKVSFHNASNGKDYACSGSSVNSGSKRLVVTAGHCVYGAPGNTWHTNWMFIPGYASGSRPCGTFTAYTMRTFNDWITYQEGGTGRGFNSDVAFVTTYNGTKGGRVLDTVGGHGLEWGGGFGFDASIFGYPGNLNGGQVMWACRGKTGSRYVGFYRENSISGCNFGGGPPVGPGWTGSATRPGWGMCVASPPTGPGEVRPRSTDPTSLTRMPSPRPPKTGPVRLPALEPFEPAMLTDIDSVDRMDVIGVDLTGADLTAASVTGSRLQRCTLTGAQLARTHLVDTALRECDATVLNAPRSSWRSVEVVGSRLGSFALYESTWAGVRVETSKIDYVNARSAQWRDVAFADCRIGELDLSDARVQRMRLDGCTIDTLTLTHARLSDVDLRGARVEAVAGLTGLAGAWITPDQLTLLAPSLATALGITVAD